MNRFFSLAEGWPGYPREAFAKVERTEPMDLEGAETLRFGLDAVPLDWQELQPGGAFFLADPGLAQRQALAWRWAFQRGGEPGDLALPHEKAPMYRLELELSAGHPWTQRLLALEDRWLHISLGDRGEVPVEVYGGLFAPLVEAFLTREPEPAAESEALDILFDMGAWPDATPDDLQLALGARCDLEALVSFDIGQGAAAALLCPHGHPIYYFDVGCGVYRNAHTTPAQLSFCLCEPAPVMLSHWDADHWSAAYRDQDLLKQAWIAPRQSISHIHTALGHDILAAGGQVLIVPPGAPPQIWGGQRRCDLRLCTGSGRNGSGLALIVTNHDIDRAWVLTGDAGYHLLPHPAPADVAAAIAPHHGANMGPKSQPPSRSPHAYGRMIYSFGPGNAHGRTSVSHPTSAGVQAHTAVGWSAGAWPPATPGHCLAGGDVLATAHHAGTHLGAAGATWDGMQPALPHLAACPRAMPVAQW